MKQELIPAYKDMEEQIKRIAKNKQKKSEPICISGKPMYLPLKGHKIEVLIIKPRKEMHQLYLVLMAVNLLWMIIHMIIYFGR